MTGPLRGSGWLHQRPTIDVVVLILSVIAALSLAAMIALVIALTLTRPEADTRAMIDLIDAQVSVIIGALLGLVAGQAQGREAERRRSGEVS